ncbi:MAG: STAS domain-containing protein [Gammaproteobacteria bacterium]|nr:STAS domain-containing protein [Gammaproteobacteria bacterium]
MEYSTHTEGSYTVLSLAGEVDLHYSPKLRKQLLKDMGAGRNVLVELSKVRYIDSSGIASLVEAYQLAKKKNLEFGLVGVSHAAMQVLQLARLDKVFPIHDSADARIASDKPKLV